MDGLDNLNYYDALKLYGQARHVVKHMRRWRGAEADGDHYRMNEHHKMIQCGEQTYAAICDGLGIRRAAPQEDFPILAKMLDEKFHVSWAANGGALC